MPDKRCNLAYKDYFVKRREDNIRSSFDIQVNFVYTQNISEFDYLIENFQRNRKTEDYDDDGNNNNVIGEGNKYNRQQVYRHGRRFWVMDDVSSFADKSNSFASFLTVARKFNFTVVYVFHTVYPSKQKLANDNFSNKNF